jgi:hypothetical protein
MVFSFKINVGRPNFQTKNIVILQNLNLEFEIFSLF